MKCRIPLTMLIVASLLCSFSVTLPMISGENQPQAENEIKMASSNHQTKPDWNKHNYNWEDFEDNGSVAVIIAIDNEQFKSLSKNLKDKLTEAKEYTYSLGFSGMSAKLDIETLDAIIQENPTIQVQPDFPVYAMVATTQTGANTMWARTDDWGYNIEGHNTTIAIIDSGVNYNHPDLGGGFGPTYKVVGGYDFYNNDADPDDDYGHGTHCAGIAAANGTIKGMAPDAKLYAYKVLGSSGTGPSSKVIQGIEAAVDPNDDEDTSDHVDVMSLSLGGVGSQDDASCLAVRAAVEAGVVVVIAAGNDGPTLRTVTSPGMAVEAITVGAVSSTGDLASFSSRGPAPDFSIKPELSAPGVDIYSTYLGTGYDTSSGTSMACPHVAGACALLLQAHPDWTPQQVKSALVEGVALIDESVWAAGSGQLYVPDAADIDIFASIAPVSFGIPSGTAIEVNFTNTGAAVSLTVTSQDWHTLLFNGTAAPLVWANISSVSVTPLDIASNTTSSELINITVPGSPLSEGFYDGEVYLTDGTHSIRLAFGFALLSELEVHVFNMLGTEVSDPRGKVMVYSYPDAVIGVGKSSTPTEASTPATFFLPSGNYTAHALGHQLFYSYSDPYVLSLDVVLGYMVSIDVNLNMTDAKECTINVTTPDDNPIYVKDILMYCAYSGTDNVSSEVTASDATIIGNELFTLTKSRNLYLSDTNATIGVFISGYSYSADMWDFMYRNWDHWYETVGSNSTEFLIESTADLHYLISWEFAGVNDSTATALVVDPVNSSTFNTKYDILGPLNDVWQAYGSHLSAGADSSPYIRRASYTSVNPFFSGMTIDAISQGVFTEYYWPGALSTIYVEPEYYLPDWGHRVATYDVEDVYLADRNYITPIEGLDESVRVGAGPFYPSVRTIVNATTLCIIHPMLRDQGGARVATPSSPHLYLYRGASLVENEYLVEHLSSPVAMREVSLVAAGNYKALITMTLASNISSTATTTIGFSTLYADMTAPYLTNLTMSQRFVPGDILPVRLSAVDDSSVDAVQIFWRSAGNETWLALGVTDFGGGSYGADIPTTASDWGVDLKFNVSDPTGNYIEYYTRNASIEQVPVLFNISVSPNEVEYIDGNVTVVVNGNLTNMAGGPIHASAAIPIELMFGDRKVAMVLDEYMVEGSHTHNGTIRFDWVLNPSRLFTGPSQSIEINATFDLGIYENQTVSFLLNSTSAAGPGAPGITTSPLTTITEDDNYYYDANSNQTIDTWALGGNCTAFLSVDPANGVVSGTPNNSYANKWYDANLSATNIYGTAYQNFSVTCVNLQPIITTTPDSVCMNNTEYYYNASHTDEGIAGGNYTLLLTNYTGYVTVNLTTGDLNFTASVVGDFWFNLTADDQSGAANATTYQNWTVTVQPDAAPTITTTAGTICGEDALYSYDADSDQIVTWGMVSNATFLSIVEATGVVSGTPTNAHAELSFYANITCTGLNGTAYENWTLSVWNAPPTITSTPSTTATEDTLYAYAANHNDEGVGVPAGNFSGIETNYTDPYTFDEVLGLLSFTPLDGGVYWFNITANDQRGVANSTVTQNWTVTITEIPPPSITTSELVGVNEDSLYSYDADADQAVNWTLETNATFLSVVVATGVVSGTPTNAHSARTYWANISCSNVEGTDYQNFTLTVWNVAPTITSTPGTTATEDTPYSYAANHNDEGVGVPAGNFSSIDTNYTDPHTFDEATGLLSFTPLDGGVYWFNITANDQRGVANSTVTQNWTITITEIPPPSITTSELVGVNEDSLYSYDANADQAVTWTLETNATFLSVNGGTGVVSGTPTNAYSARTYWVNISCSNVEGVDYQNFTLTVWNRAPVISTSPTTTATQDTPYSYSADHSDEGVGGGNFTGVTTNYTGVYTFVESTGVLTFTPDTSGVFWFNITADDQRDVANSTVTQNWTVTVSAVAIVEPTTPDPTIPSSAQASFSYVVRGDTIYCTDSSHGEIVSWYWSFGDGSGSASQNPNHDYRTSGLYLVSLTVYDVDGRQNTASGVVAIESGNDYTLDWDIEDLSFESDGSSFASTTMIVFAIGLGFVLSSKMSMPFLPKKIRLVLGVVLMIGVLYYAGGYW